MVSHLIVCSQEQSCFEDADSVMKDILCLYPDDVLEEKGMTKEDIVFGDSSTVANQFRKAIMKEKNNNLSKRGIQTIYREGYYTVMDAISIAQNFDTAECMRKLCSVIIDSFVYLI